MPTRKKGNQKIQKQQKIINKLVCNYIAGTYLSNTLDTKGKKISQNDYAETIDISSSVLTKMKKDEGYEIPLATIYSICEKEKISLSDFFRNLEENFPEVKIKK